MSSRLLFFTLLYFVVTVYCQENNRFFLKAAKSVPRIGRSNKGSSADFEKFFLKASKSVPRIGRRNQSPFAIDYDMDGDLRARYPTWSEIASRYEYEPELFSSPEFLARLEEEMGDDPTVYDWDKVRLKRGALSTNGAKYGNKQN